MGSNFPFIPIDFRMGLIRTVERYCAAFETVMYYSVTCIRQTGRQSVMACNRSCGKTLAAMLRHKLPGKDFVDFCIRVISIERRE